MRFLYFLSVLILSALYGFGQSQIIYDESDKESFLIVYDVNEQSPKNQIIEILARGNDMRARNAEFTLKLRQKRRVLKKGNKLRLIIELDRFKISGPVEYKGFSAEHLLVPDRVGLKAVLLKGNSQIGQYNVPGASITGENSRILDIEQADSTAKGSIRLLTESKEFKYTASDKHRLQTFADYADDYWQALRNTQRKLRRINEIGLFEEEPEQAPDLQTIRDLSALSNDNLNFVRQTQKSKFVEELQLSSHDPENLLQKTDKLKGKSRRLYDNTNTILQNPEVFYFNKGLDAMRRNNLSSAQRYFEQSVHENREFAPAHVQLGSLFYRQGFRKNALEQIFLVKRLNPDPDTEQINNELAEGIYQDIILEASDLNNQGAYDDALYILSQAEQICREFRRVRCRAAMDNETAFAVKGKYHILTEKAHKAMQNGKLNDAEQWIDRAYDYRKKNLTLIPQKEEITGLIRDLYSGYIDEAENYNRSSRFENAVSSLDQAQRICKKYPEIKCGRRLQNVYTKAYYGIYESRLQEARNAYSRNQYEQADQLIQKAVSYRKAHDLKAASGENSLILKIKKGLYDSYILLGNREKDAGNYAKSLEYFDQAADIEKQFSIKRNPQLTAYTKSAAEGHTQQYISCGIDDVNINDLKSARANYSQAKNTAKRYNIIRERDIAAALSNLKDRIFEQECINAQAKFDDLFSQAELQIQDKNFTEAERLLQQAELQADKFRECEIDLEQLNKTQNEIADAVQYQSFINTSVSLIKRGEFSSALNDYLKAGRFYQQNNVARYNLSHDNLHDFARRQNNDFINYTIGYLTKEARYNKALSLLSLLAADNYSARKTKDHQFLLGAELAKKDFKENPDADKRANIAAHTHDGWFYRFFRRGYRRQWRKLD